MKTSARLQAITGDQAGGAADDGGRCDGDQASTHATATALVLWRLTPSPTAVVGARAPDRPECFAQDRRRSRSTLPLCSVPADSRNDPTDRPCIVLVVGPEGVDGPVQLGRGAYAHVDVAPMSEARSVPRPSRSGPGFVPSQIRRSGAHAGIHLDHLAVRPARCVKSAGGESGSGRHLSARHESAVVACETRCACRRRRRHYRRSR